MKLFADLFSSDVGLLSIGTIGIVLLMSVYYIWFFINKYNEATKNGGEEK